MNDISIQNRIEALAGSPVGKEQASGGKDSSFGTALETAIGEVKQFREEADQAVRNLALGKEENIHHTMIALEKAEVSFRLMMQVRNKIVAAYEEIMRMQV